MSANSKIPSKVLLVVTHGSIGGAQKRVYELALKYKELGYDVTLGMGEEGPLVQMLSEANITHHHFTYLKRSHSLKEALSFSNEMKRYVEKCRPDIVHCNSSNTLAGAWGAKRVKKKYRPLTVFTFRGLSVLDPSAPTSWYKRLIYKKYFTHFLKYIDLPVFQCQRNKEEAEKMNLVKSGEIIHPGIDLTKLNFFSRENARFQVEKATKTKLENVFVVGTIGRLTPEKNHSFLIKNFRYILEGKKNAIFVIIGDGPERDTLERLVENLKLQDRVFLLGEIENASSYLPGFDMFVLPSLFEGISVALTEALIAGLPLLASDVGGNSEVIYGKYSATYKPGDFADFYRKFKAITGEEGVSRKNEAPLQDHIDKFLLENSSAKYLKLYHSQD